MAVIGGGFRPPRARAFGFEAMRTGIRPARFPLLTRGGAKRSPFSTELRFLVSPAVPSRPHHSRDVRSGGEVLAGANPDATPLSHHRGQGRKGVARESQGRGVARWALIWWARQGSNLDQPVMSLPLIGRFP
jgi:hypothetical protein